MQDKQPNRYQALVESLFFCAYQKESAVVPFTREELVATATTLGIVMPKNAGDVLYSFRYRNPLPTKILDTQPEGMEWVIEGVGRAKYEFRLVPINRITPNPNLITINGRFSHCYLRAWHRKRWPCQNCGRTPLPARSRGPDRCV